MRFSLLTFILAASLPIAIVGNTSPVFAQDEFDDEFDDPPAAEVADTPDEGSIDADLAEFEQDDLPLRVASDEDDADAEDEPEGNCHLDEEPSAQASRRPRNAPAAGRVRSSTGRSRP